jgi:hypothetical protein
MERLAEPLTSLGLRGFPMTTTYANYMRISGNLEQYSTLTSKRTEVATATTYYEANIGSVKSVDDLLGNDRLYRYAMKAFGLEDMTYAKAMVRQVLEGGTSSSDSLANTLSDKRFLALAKAFDFETHGEEATSRTAATTDVVSSYVRQSLEDNAESEGEGVQLALYFERKASSVTSAYGILADADLLKVVQTALGISELTAYQDIDKQAETISSMLDIEELQDPAFVKKFLGKFAALYDATTTSADSSASSTSLLFAGSQVGISTDLLSAIQGMRLGGL